MKGDEGFPLILVGNKCELDESKREVSRSRAGSRAQVWNVGYIETSAKSGLNVNKVFCDLIKDIQSRRKPNIIQSYKAIQHNENREDGQSCCFTCSIS